MRAESRAKGSRGRLTAHFVQSVNMPGKYHDRMGMGLMLRVMPSGSKQWVQRLMCHDARVELGLGSPPYVSLVEARDKAIDNKRLVYNGGNPLAQKAANAAIPTFEAASEEAVAVHSKGKADKYGVRFMGALKLHVFPHIGRKKVNVITAGELNSILEKLIVEKPMVAKKVKDYVSVVLKWCIGKDFITVSPMDQASVFLPKIVASGKHRVALPYTEVNALLEKLGSCNVTFFTKLSLEFLILTAARSNEVRGAKWSEINFDTRLWTIPMERMKARVAHVVPLSDRAIEILEAARDMQEKTSPSMLIFPSAAGVVLADSRLSKLVKESLEYMVDVHGFRTSFRMWAQETTTFSEEACEVALAHAVGNSSRRAYARSELLGERALLMQAWSDYLKIPTETWSKAE